MFFYQHAEKMEKDTDYFFNNHDSIMTSLCQESELDHFLDFIYLSSSDEKTKNSLLDSALNARDFDLSQYYSKNNFSFLQKHIKSFFYDTYYDFLIDFLKNDFIKTIAYMNDKHKDYPELKNLFNRYNLTGDVYDNDIVKFSLLQSLNTESKDVILPFMKDIEFDFLNTQIKQTSITFGSNASENSLIINVLLNKHYAFPFQTDDFLPIFSDIIFNEVASSKSINVNKKSFMAFLFYHLETNGEMSNFLSEINESLLEQKAKTGSLNKLNLLFFVDGLFNCIKNSNNFTLHHHKLCSHFDFNDSRDMKWCIDYIKNLHPFMFKEKQDNLYEDVDKFLNIQFEKESLSNLTKNNVKATKMSRL